MGSLEELFVRQEFEGNTTYDEIVGWLTGPKRDEGSYKNTAIKLAEPFGIRESAKELGVTIENAEEWRNLKQEVKSLSFKEPITKDLIQTKLDIVEKLESKEVERQEKLLIEEQSKDFLISEYKEAETTEERKELRKELKSELPYSLRSLKGWETRKGQEAFRFVFEE